MASFEGFEYDVLIVGSGAGGGMSAHILTEAGIRVLLLEAGRNYDPVTETPISFSVRSYQGATSS